ncbi:crinkler (CRN) family protein, putative [Rhizophagus clarus]|uniref:Crinkler (CRN) family protein, putative n=1 Tax=Rhizophagus clarus TaxID=94130 RepID=A0A8H3M5P9_9GLOM|nr:crinkler (CRN) family protein, putative [Rhizophagus clarus]
MSNYSLLSRVLSPFRVQTKFEENSLPARSSTVSIRYREIMVFCIVLGDNTETAFPVKLPSDKKVGELRELITKINPISFTNIDAKDLILWQVSIPDEDVRRMKILNTKPPSDINIEELGGKVMSSRKEIEFYFPKDPVDEHIHIIIVRPQPPATTGTDGGSLSIPMKRQAEPQDYDNNRKPVAPHVREFWNELSKAQIVLKLPDNADKTIYTSERLSKYMKVEENKIVLNDNVMLNSQDELIFCDGSPVIESEVVKMDFVKFLRFRISPNEIVDDIDSQDILIKKSYLQMIEKIELDRADGTKGCVIVGSPGIGKAHFSLYLAFYITRRYNSDDIMYEQRFKEKSRLLHIRSNGAVMIVVNPEHEYPQGDFFYIVDSDKPAPWKTKYTFLVTTPKCNLWHDFVKTRPRKYYAPIWSEEEIWNVWNWNDQYKNKVSETRVRELIKKWGCIPRRVFVEHNDEPDLAYLVSKCDVYRVIKNDGGDLDNEYSGKVIHIIPNNNFTDKKFVPASAEVNEALYRHYETHTKDAIINLIRDLAGGAGGTFAGNFFEMLAHDVLRKGGKFKIRRLTDDNHKWPAQNLDLQGLEPNRYDDVQGINSGYYNFPKIKNFESVDAIAPQCNGIHHLYQITIARKHDTKVNGLLKLETHLGGNLPIHLYFVVPSINHIFDNFHFQNYVTTGGDKYKGWNTTTKWVRDNIEQYVLEIELDKM